MENVDYKKILEVCIQNLCNTIGLLDALVTPKKKMGRPPKKQKTEDED